MTQEKNLPKVKKNATATKKKEQGFSAQEKAAMKERAKELKAAERASKNRAEGEKAVFEKIAEMDAPYRVLAERIHEIVLSNAPELFPRTWYGMPAYSKDDKVVLFFQSADKFESRYSTLGFNDAANLDDGEFWPTAFALTKITPQVESQIAELVKKAVS
ncbi:MAG TPA: hypothetical protein VK856_15070 [Anaerolineaceae bacterium]|nr:hypothetical protein [Anaerolineaceae bacterium]